MAPSLGICKLCEKETAKYKCSVCSIPYCSLTCYKPHKEIHDQEKASQPPGTNPDATTTSADGSSINTSTAAAGASTSINQDQPPKPIDLKILLNRPALISFIRSNSVLKTQLLSIHNSTLKSTFDAENARIIAQNERSGFNNNSNSNNHNSNSNNRGGRGGMRGGFRGGRQGGGGFNKRPIDWTVERGMNRGLKRIKDLRKGGRQENAEFEEFALEVMRILEEGSAAPSGAAGQVS